MPIFNNLKALETHLKAKINETLMDDVAAAVRKVEQSQIQKTVYDATKPRGYDRRKESGGLVDPDNITAELSGDGVLKIRNVTKPNMEYETSMEYDDDLPSLIEYGDGYDGMEYDYDRSDGTDYEYKNPRPFTENTRNELIKTKQHIIALQKGLNRRGI